MHDSPVSLFELFITDEIVNFILCIGRWEMTAGIALWLLHSQKIDFFDVLQYIHFADNNHLDTNDKFAKVQLLFKILNENCLKNFIPERNASIDESMVLYYGRDGCKQYMQNKPVKFGYKLWVAATPVGYAIQFYPYAGKDANYDKDLGLSGSVVMSLVSKFPSTPKSNYHIVMDNFFTSPSLLWLLKSKSIVATGAVRLNRTENSPLISIEEMKKKPRGICDVVNDRKANVTLVNGKTTQLSQQHQQFLEKNQ